MTTEEMNTAIAEKIYGWKLVTTEEHGRYHTEWTDQTGKTIFHKDGFSPTTSIAQATELLKRFQELEHTMVIEWRHRVGWIVDIDGIGRGHDTRINGLAYTICMACLEMHGGKKHA